MKKNYMKPFLAVEFLQIDAAAAGCSQQLPVTDYDCSPDNYTFFDVTCQVDLNDVNNVGDDTFCYHGPMWAPGGTYVSS